MAYIKCPDCSGSGYYGLDRNRTCERCYGRGQIEAADKPSSSSSGSSENVDAIIELKNSIRNEIKNLNEDINNILSKGKEYLKNGKYDAAISQFNEILRLKAKICLYNKFFDLYDNSKRGSSKEREAFDALDEAEKLSNKSVENVLAKDDASFWVPYKYLGQAYFNKNDYTQSLVFINNSLACLALFDSENNKNDCNAKHGSDLLLWRGKALESLGKTKEAIDDWKFSHDFAPNEEAVKNLARNGIQYARKPKKFTTSKYGGGDTKAAKIARITSTIAFAFIFGILPGFGFFRLIIGAVFGLILGWLFLGRFTGIFAKIFVSIGALYGSLAFALSGEFGMMGGGVINILFSTAYHAAIGLLIGFGIDWLKNMFYNKRALKVNVKAIVKIFVIVVIIAAAFFGFLYLGDRVKTNDASVKFAIGNTIVSQSYETPLYENADDESTVLVRVPENTSLTVIDELVKYKYQLATYFYIPVEYDGIKGWVDSTYFD